MKLDRMGCKAHKGRKQREMYMYIHTCIHRHYMYIYIYIYMYIHIHVYVCTLLYFNFQLMLCFFSFARNHKPPLRNSSLHVLTFHGMLRRPCDAACLRLRELQRSSVIHSSPLWKKAILCRAGLGCGLRVQVSKQNVSTLTMIPNIVYLGPVGPSYPLVGVLSQRIL